MSPLINLWSLALLQIWPSTAGDCSTSFLFLGYSVCFPQYCAFPFSSQLWFQSYPYSLLFFPLVHSSLLIIPSSFLSSSLPVPFSFISSAIFYFPLSFLFTFPFLSSPALTFVAFSCFFLSLPLLYIVFMWSVLFPFSLSPFLSNSVLLLLWFINLNNPKLLI